MSMLRLKLLAVALFVVLATGAVPSMTAAQTDRLPARLFRALTDLDRRDPDVAKALRGALEHNYDEAVRHLEAHARQLDELAAAKKESPAKYRLILQDRNAHREVTKLVARIRDADPDARGGLLDELRARMRRWFDVRQSLRKMEHDRLTESIAAHRKRLAAQAENRLETCREWLGRLTEGGRPSIEARIVSLGDRDPKHDAEALGPAVLEIAAAADPEKHTELSRLSERDPDAFRERVRRFLASKPRLANRIRRHAKARLVAHRKLRAAMLEALEIVQPHVPDQGSARLPKAVRATLTRALERVVDAAHQIAEIDLARTERHAEAKRKELAERIGNRELLVELQMARIFHRTAKYEW